MAARSIPPDAGASAVGLLSALMIVSAIAFAIFALHPGQKSSHASTGSATTIDASPSHASSDISEAAQAACQADYQAVQSAVSEYEALTGRPPTSMSALASIVRDPVSTYFYDITIDPHHPGQIEVATPGRPSRPGEVGCTSAG